MKKVLWLIVCLMTMVLSVNAHNVHYPTYTEDGITYVKAGVSNAYINGCWYEQWNIRKVDKPNAKTIIIPYMITINGEKAKVLDIEENAFESCVSLDSLIISDGLMLIQNTKGFKGCRKLEYLYYSSNSANSNPNAYQWMSGLSCKTLETNIGSPERSFWNTISGSLEKLIIRGETFFGVFNLCKNLRTIICYSNKAPSVIAPSVGYSCEDDKFQSWQWSTITLYVPRESLENYYFNRVWGEIDNIYAIDEITKMSGVTTSISHTTNNTSTSDAWYTLNGTKVDKPTKGVYIKDGKKYIINKN